MSSTEFQAGTRNRSYEQIDELMQKNCPISISQTSIFLLIQPSPPQTFMGFWDEVYYKFQGYCTQTLPNPSGTLGKYKNKAPARVFLVLFTGLEKYPYPHD